MPTLRLAADNGHPSPTYACPAECKDCGTLSSARAKEPIGIDVVKRYVEEAGELSDFQVVVFTGGEATLRWQDLLQGIAHARAQGLAPAWSPTRTGPTATTRRGPS